MLTLLIGFYLKPALVQCTHAAVKSTTAYYKNKYERISKKRGKKRTIIAIARMILTAIYQMLSTSEACSLAIYLKLICRKRCRIETFLKYSNESLLKLDFCFGIKSFTIICFNNLELLK